MAQKTIDFKNDILEPIASLKEDTTVLQKRQNVLVGSETGNPVSCDDAFAAPLCGLNVYGKSTQDGTPSPDNPVPIMSAGDSGSVAVKVMSRNILDMRNSVESVNGAGITYTRNADYSFTRTGTATDKTGNLWLAGGFNIAPLPDGSNVLCTLKMGVKYNITGCVLLAKTQAGIKSAKGTNFTPTKDLYITGARNEEFKIDKTYNDIVTPAVYVGANALPYEPYREQLLTLQTPNGLPGIPVASGGNYTDQNGQQWVCDEVDLERGMKVQRVESRRILSSEVKDTILGVNSCYIIERNMTRPANNQQICHVMCTHLERASWSSVVDKGVQGICTISNQPYIGISIQGFKSANEYKDFIDKNEVGIAYELATPIETPLTPAEIAAYKALTAYAPDTVVQASDGAGIKLDYQRDVNLVVKNLEDAIASMTTT